MAFETSKRFLIFLMLGLLAASAFFVRLENFKKDNLRSIDEFVYYRMANQVLAQGLSGYHTMPFGKEMADEGRPLPSYFFNPLFKHPPIFTFLLCLSMNLFGTTLLAAVFVPLLFGALIIPLTYLIGKELFNSGIGLAAAVFMWIDPVNVMTSQKVWMDTTMSFFMLLSFYFFIKGMQPKSGRYLLLGGLVCGLAMLTKYTGILTLVSVAAVVFVYRRDLFLNKNFIISLALPFIMLLPWGYWNYLVYGKEFLIMQESFHHNFRLVRFFIFGVAALLLILIVRKLFERFSKTEVSDDEPGFLSIQKVNIVLGFFLLGSVYASIYHSLQIDYLPRTSWTSATFKLDPPVFYVGQLIEYSFIYFFAFAALFIERSNALMQRAWLKYASVITLIFFTAWRSFQCRYVLFAIPLLAILGFELIVTIFQKIEKIDSAIVRTAVRSGFAVLIAYALARTLYIDVYLSFTNDMCYY